MAKVSYSSGGAARMSTTPGVDELGFRKQETVTLLPPANVRWSKMQSTLIPLPMNPSWNFFLVVTILINFYFGTLCFFFANNLLVSFIPIYVICDLVYLLNLVLLGFHQWMKRLQRKIYTARVNKICYFLDVLSFIPQELLALPIFGATSMVTVSLRWCTYFRLRHSFFFFKSLQQVHELRWKTFLIAFCIVGLLIQHIATCGMYVASGRYYLTLTPNEEPSPPSHPYEVRFRNLSTFLDVQDNINGTMNSTKEFLINGTTKIENTGRDDLNGTKITYQTQNDNWYEGRWSQKLIEKFPFYEDAETVDWYFICSYAVLETFLTYGGGIVEPTRSWEMMSFSIIMIVGFLFFDVWFLSFIFTLLTAARKSRANYVFRINSIKLYLQDVNVSKETLQNIGTYFRILWQKKEGIKTSSHFATLPSPLRMEIMYDINYAYLHRSVLFGDLQEFYMRKFALLMKHEFLLPGDVLYHQGVVKTDLVIIATGILEILSDEDDESPVIAFKAGTVLGEACLFWSLPAKATVRAAVYSEVKLIKRIDFMRNMANYPIALMFLRQRVYHRIKILQEKKRDYNVHVTMGLGTDKDYISPIKVLKDRLAERQRNALPNKEITRRISVRDTEVVEEQKIKHGLLALYQLSNEDSNIETPVICLTYNFPWIFDSTSSLIKMWEQVVILIHMAFILVYVYQVVFLRYLDVYARNFRYASDLICFIDVLLLLCTTIVIKDRILLTFKEIMTYRMKSITFHMNAFSLFPYEYLMIILYKKDDTLYARMSDLWIAMKLLRFVRVWLIVIRIRTAYCYENTLYHILYTLVGLCVITYLIAGGLFLFSCMFELCTEDSWYYHLILKAVQNKEERACYLFPFASSIYLAASTWTHLGLGDIQMMFPRDLAMTMIFVLLGILVVTFMMASVASTMSMANTKAKAFQEEVHSFVRFLEHHDVPFELRHQVRKFFSLQWVYDRGVGRHHFSVLAPRHLRMIVFKAELLPIMKKIPLFQAVDVDFLVNLVISTTITILPEGSTVCYAGDVDREMFILQKGCCSVFNHKGEFVGTLEAGDYFGDVEMLFNMSKTTTVRTTTHCKIVLVTFRAFNSTLSMFPGEMRIARDIVTDPELLQEKQTIELKQNLEFVEDETHPPKLSKKKYYMTKIRNSFIFAANCYRTTDGLEKYWDPFRNMGKLQFLGCFLMPITIHPEGFILKIWLIYRMSFLLALAICIPMALGTPPSLEVNYLIMFVVEISAYFELYLFLHVAYYNEQGLLISHPKLTAIHYLSHGFALDCISALPYYVILPWSSFDIDNLDHTIKHLVAHETYCQWRAISLCQFHRLISFVNYLQEEVTSRKSLYSFLIILPLSLVILLVLTTLVITECQYKFFTQEMEMYMNLWSKQIEDPVAGITYYGYFICNNASWIQYVAAPISNPVTVVSYAFYWFLNVFGQVGFGDISATTKFTMYACIGICFAGIFIFAYILAFVSGEAGRSQVLTLEYQQKLQDLLNFLHKEGVADSKIHKLYRYFEYVWNRTSGMQKKEMLMDLNTGLKGDISLLLYEETLREVHIFQHIEKPYLKVIAKNLRELYLVKHDTIIKCYDVHNSVYIVMRGAVDVFTPYEEHIATIEIGGLFGNIHQSAPGCSTVTFIARRNVDTLKMSSETLFRIAQEYPAVRKVLYEALKNAGDFILPTDATNRPKSKRSAYYEGDVDEEEGHVTKKKSKGHGDDISIVRSASKQTLAAMEAQPRIIVPKSNCQACMLFLKPRCWFRFALEPDHIIFKYLWYITFFCACYQMCLIPVWPSDATMNTAFVCLSLSCEPVFYIRIFFFMHEAYLDQYGIYVKKFRLIARHYFRDYKRVAWDFIPNLPLYLFFLMAPPEKQTLTFSILRLFQLLRFKYVMEAFARWSAPLMAPRAPILTIKMVMIFLLTIHYFTLIAFSILAYHEGEQLYLRKATPWDGYTFCLYCVASTISTTGVGLVTPDNHIELTFAIILLIVTKIVYSMVIGGFLMGVKIYSQEVIEYESKVNRMKTFLRNQGLSGHLMQKLWVYVRQIWMREKGVHMPKLLEKAPYVMRCDILRDIYSVHLRNGYLFKNINEALLNQICGHLRRVVFFKGNYIVQHGDTNASMYWIHHGEVSVLTVHPNLTETKHAILQVHDMFGLAQGLNYGMPHKYSYRAHTNCDILVLKLDTWEYVLQHFPQDKDIIYKRMLNAYSIV